jgi:uncharacterized membrane protein
MSFALQPHWLRVDLDAEQSRLCLTSRGRSLVIAGFLPPDERAEVADALRAALARLRDPSYG